MPGIRENTKKIEEPEIVYQYLDTLPVLVRQGINPLLVDCLNCYYGCNAGPGTLNQDKLPDLIEHEIGQRSLEARRPCGGRSANYQLRMPSESQFAVLYTEMLRTKGVVNASTIVRDIRNTGAHRLDEPFLAGDR